jgi:hypothetical protein
MLALLPDIDQFKESGFIDGEWYFNTDKLIEATHKSLVELRKLSDCPGCIMAALRQKGIPTPIVTDFNFREESAKAWAIFNESQM